MSATAGEANYKENYLDKCHLNVMIIKKAAFYKKRQPSANSDRL